MYGGRGLGFFSPNICILFSKKSKVDCSHSHNKSKSYWLVYCLKELHLQIVFVVQLFSTLALKKCNACVYLWGWFQWVESPVLFLLPLFKLKGRVTLQKLLKAFVPFYHWWIMLQLPIYPLFDHLFLIYAFQAPPLRDKHSFLW